jgi:hypothetical protein
VKEEGGVGEKVTASLDGNRKGGLCLCDA